MAKSVDLVDPDVSREGCLLSSDLESAEAVVGQVATGLARMHTAGRQQTYV